MRILLIKPKPIGDTLILTPTITALRQGYPESEIWVLVRRGCETILAGCPGIDKIVALPDVEKSERSPADLWRQLALLWQLRREPFDYVFELGDGPRARLFARLVRARRRYAAMPAEDLRGLDRRLFTAVSSYEWGSCHRVEKDLYSVHEFLPLPSPIPRLTFKTEFTRAWEPARCLGDFALLQIGSRQLANRWSRDHWRAVGRALLQRFPHLVISCGPVRHEIEDALWLQEELRPNARTTRGEASWAQVAWLLDRAKLYVGPDTAAMHLAAACQCPVVALFGPSIDDYWRPWRVPHRIVAGPPSPNLPPEQPFARMKSRRMEDIEPAAVIAACDDLLADCARNECSQEKSRALSLPP
jgi:heptosyltransferase-3